MMAAPTSRFISPEQRNIQISMINRLALQHLDRVLKPYYPLERQPDRHVFHDIDLVDQATADKSFTPMGMIVFATEKLKAWEAVISSAYPNHIHTLVNPAATAGIPSPDPATLLQLTLPHDLLSHPPYSSLPPAPDAEGNITIKEEYLRRLELENHVYRRHLAHLEHLIHEKVEKSVNELADALCDSGFFEEKQKGGVFEGAIDPAAETGVNIWGVTRDEVIDIMDEERRDERVGNLEFGRHGDVAVKKEEEEEEKEKVGGAGRGVIQRTREGSGERELKGGAMEIIDLTEDVGEKFREMSVSAVEPAVVHERGPSTGAVNGVSQKNKDNIVGPAVVLEQGMATRAVGEGVHFVGERVVGSAVVGKQGTPTGAVSNIPMPTELATNTLTTTTDNSVRHAGVREQGMLRRSVNDTKPVNFNGDAGPIKFEDQAMLPGYLGDTLQATIENCTASRAASRVERQELPTGPLGNVPRGIFGIAAASGLVREQGMPPIGYFKSPSMNRKRRLETSIGDEEFTPLQKKMMR